MLFLHTPRCLHTLECVTERPMAKIMQKCGNESDLGLFRRRLLFDPLHFPIDNFHQNARSVENADRMCKARVDGAGECKFGYAELPDTA